MTKVLEWMDWYHEVEKYYEEYGNIDMSVKYETKEGLKLGQWLHRQRQIYKGNMIGRIMENQVQLLNDLGMKWEVQKETWNENYYALEEYYKKYGNIDVPRNYVTQEGLKLGLWLNTQRQAYNGKSKCKITEEQILLLNKLEMKWNIDLEKWDTYYYALENYYKEHGNIDILVNYVTDDGLKLGSWLNNQKKAYRGKNNLKIRADRIQLLNDLNIDWSVHDTKLLNMKIKKENRDKYYSVLNDRLNHVLNDISYEVSNEITEENQNELCKQIIKRVWR
mgnify:CR=1 FL=1